MIIDISENTALYCRSATELKTKKKDNSIKSITTHAAKKSMLVLSLSFVKTKESVSMYFHF